MKMWLNTLWKNLDTFVYTITTESRFNYFLFLLVLYSITVGDIEKYLDYYIRNSYYIFKISFKNVFKNSKLIKTVLYYR